MYSTTQSLVWVLLKFSHLQGEVTSKYLYVVDARAANASTKVFAGHLLAKELRSRSRFQPSDIRRADDATQALTRCHYRGVSYCGFDRCIIANVYSITTTLYMVISLGLRS
jgi:hypothetical protein